MELHTVINAIGSYIPVGRIDNYRQAEEFGYERQFIDQKIGAGQLSRKSSSEDTSDLAFNAVRDLVNAGLDLSDIDGLLVCTQNPDGFGLPHTSAIVHEKLNLLKRCAAFDISLGCSGYVYGLAVADGIMRSQGLKNVILVTSDPYSKVVDPKNKDTAMLFGDAATATWLIPWELAGPKGKLGLGSAVFGTDGSGACNLTVGPERTLFMNGREVFNFSARMVPAQILELLTELNLTTDDIDYFLLHQGSKYIVDTITRRLKVPPEKVPLGISKCGNTVSSSIPLMLADLVMEQNPKRVILSGFGVGLSYATMMLEEAPA